MLILHPAPDMHVALGVSTSSECLECNKGSYSTASGVTLAISMVFCGSGFVRQSGCVYVRILSAANGLCVQSQS